MRVMKIKNGRVDNVLIYDECPAGLEECPDHVSVGWTEDGQGGFNPPEDTGE